MPTGRERNRARRKYLADDEIRTRGPELKEVSERTRKNDNERTKEMIEKQRNKRKLITQPKPNRTKT